MLSYILLWVIKQKNRAYMPGLVVEQDVKNLTVIIREQFAVLSHAVDGQAIKAIGQTIKGVCKQGSVYFCKGTSVYWNQRLDKPIKI